MAVNEVWNLQVKGVSSGTQHIHGLHFLSNTVGGGGTDLITAWQGAPQTAYRAIFPTHQSIIQIIRAAKVCGSVPLPAPTEVGLSGAPSMGTRSTTTTDQMPSFMACLVNVKSTFAGRRYNGRFFLGGLMETDVTSNDILAPYLALVQAYIDALKSVFVTPLTPDWRLFVFSNLLADGDPNHTTGGISTPVAAHPCQEAGGPVANLLVSARPTTMRSRKLGSGL